MRAALAIALCSSVAWADVSSTAGALKVVDAGAVPRRALKLAGPKGPEKLTLHANIEQGPTKLVLDVDLAATPASGVWALKASRVSMNTGSPLPATAQAEFDAACTRAAAELRGSVRIGPHMRISDVSWTLPDAGKDPPEAELRRAIVHFLNAAGEILPLLGEVLPGTPVGAGASWDSTAAVKKEVGEDSVTMTGRAHYEAVAVDPAPKLRVTTRLAVAPVTVRGKKLSLSGDLTGTVQLDETRALPAALQLESLMTFSIEGEQASMRIQLELTLR